MIVRNAWNLPASREVEYTPVSKPEDATYLPVRGDLVVLTDDDYTTPRLFVVLKHQPTIVASDIPAQGGVVTLRESDDTGRTYEYGDLTCGAHQIVPAQ